MAGKQVSKSHYEFSKYMTKERWISVWHQVDEIVKLNPESVLEIGQGSGLLKVILSLLNIQIETFDVDAELEPDHVGSATDLRLESNSYDLVCAFQVLEHLPFPSALVAFNEMVRVSRGHILISLPDSMRTWYYRLHIPLVGTFRFNIPVPRLTDPVHFFDGEHYWELNKKGYGLKNVIASFSQNALLIRSFRVRENSYHKFFLFKIYESTLDDLKDMQ